MLACPRRCTRPPDRSAAGSTGARRTTGRTDRSASGAAAHRHRSSDDAPAGPRFGLRTLDLHAAPAPARRTPSTCSARLPGGRGRPGVPGGVSAPPPGARRGGRGDDSQDPDAGGRRARPHERPGMARGARSRWRVVAARPTPGRGVRAGDGAPTTDPSAINLVYLLGDQPPGGRLSLTGMSDERYRIAGGNDGCRDPSPRPCRGGDPASLALRAHGRESDGHVALDFETPTGRRASASTTRSWRCHCRRPWPRLRAGRARPAEAARDEGSRDGTRLEAPRAAVEPLVAPAGAAPAGAGVMAADDGPLVRGRPREDSPGTRPPRVLRARRDVRRHGGSAALRETPAPTRSGRRGAVQPCDAGDRLDRGHARLERAGDTVRALPRSDLERLVLVCRVGRSRLRRYEGVRQRDVHFAGERASTKSGFMEGAAAEGVQAARALLANLRPKKRPPSKARRA